MWKSIREKFGREDKKGYTSSGAATVDKAVSTWSLFPFLFFLKDHVIPRNTTSNATKPSCSRPEPRRSPRIASQESSPRLSDALPHLLDMIGSTTSSSRTSSRASTNSDVTELNKSLLPELSNITDDKEPKEVQLFFSPFSLKHAIF
jgi:hypothetical protein